MNTVLYAVVEGMMGEGTFDEWWATNNPNVAVLTNGKFAVEVSVRIVPVPSTTPAEVENGIAPHPYGWEQEGVTA